jgi:PST family polysaccharide transporter
MLGEMVGEEAVGVYSVAVQLTEVWYFITWSIILSVFPSIVHSREHQSELDYRRRVQLFYDIIAGVSYAILLPVTLIASPLVISLYGPSYGAAGPMLKILMWSFLFGSLGMALERWLVVEGLVQFQLFATSLGAAINIVLNYWLLPQYGALGATWATVISYAVSGYLICLLWPRVWPVFGQLTLSIFMPFRLHSLKRSLEEILGNR